jgi:phospho-N-acetylmuramoyl-pentapeptide-transferase
MSRGGARPPSRPMLYFLVDRLQSQLSEWGLLWLVQVMFQLEFRAFAAVVLSFFLVIAWGPRCIRWLRQQKVGDIAEFQNARINELMESKRGTPTMGGLFLCGSILVAILLLADPRSLLVQLSVAVLVWLSGVGMIDDWLKLTAGRRAPGSRDGLHAWEKLLFQGGLAIIVGFFLWRDLDGRAPEMLALNLPFQRTFEPIAMSEAFLHPPQVNPGLLVLPAWLFILVAVLWIVLCSNAVNISDGMDGLAGGCLSITAIALMVLCYIAGTSRVSWHLLVPHVPGAGELMVVSAAIAGACLGFLWFNCSPAKVFMGDTGSLPLGGLLGFITLAIRQEALLLLVGAIFFIEAASVILQVGWFKSTGGRRIFACAPIHHHFHLKGWSEHQVVTRFWVVTIVMAMVAMASIKLR